MIISKPPLFSFEECLWYLNRNFDDCLYSIKPNKVIKAISIDNEVFLISVHEAQNHLEIRTLLGSHKYYSEKALVEYISDWFDLSRDLKPFYALLKKNKMFSHLIEDYKGLRMMGISDLFEALCWSIIGQQINLTFAYKLKRRLVERYGTVINFEEENYYLFPNCHTIAQANIEDLRAMQFSQKKAEYIIGVAQVFARGEMSKEILKSLPDMESQQKALVKLRGIGIWTANYVLMKTFRASSAIPFGDSGLLKVLENYKIIESRKEDEKIFKFFSQFKGWESYLVFYLWRALSPKP